MSMLLRLLTVTTIILLASSPAGAAEVRANANDAYDPEMPAADVAFGHSLNRIVGTLKSGQAALNLEPDRTSQA
jgi:hypothetical protein